MKYKIQNTSVGTTVWVDAFNQGNAFPLEAGQKCTVPESIKTQLLREYPFLVTLGTITDDNAPAYYSAAPGVAWTLVTLGPGSKQYSSFRFMAATAPVEISFSGWNPDAPDSQTAPPTWSVINVPVSTAVVPWIEINLVMDPTNQIYAKGTGTLTVIAS